MKKRHIAFISFPRLPHVNPTLPIVSTLVRRGHRVTYTTSTQFASKIVQLGAEYVACPSPDRTHGEEAMCRQARETLAAVTSFYEANRPDLIVYDVVALAGRVLAHKWNIPRVMVSPHPSFDEATLKKQIRNTELREWALDASRRADHFLRGYGIRSKGFIFHREELNIHPFPKEFDPNGSAAGDSCLYAGRCPGEQPHSGDWRGDPKSSRPFALIVSSTTYIRGSDYFDMCLQALSALPWDVILMPGDDSQLESLSPLPENVEHVRGTSPAKVLSSAKVLICTGGAMTVSEAMYHGVPLVMTSCGIRELEGLCEMWLSLGLGVHLKLNEMTAENLRRAVTHVAEDPEILRKVRQMQRVVQQAPGAEEVANRIEELFERRCEYK